MLAEKGVLLRHFTQVSTGTIIAEVEELRSVSSLHALAYDMFLKSSCILISSPDTLCSG